jgi:hypothetical protein
MNPSFRLVSVWRSFPLPNLVFGISALLAIASSAAARTPRKEIGKPASSTAGVLGSQELGGGPVALALLNQTVSFEAAFYDIPNTGAAGSSRATPPNCVGDIGPTQFLVCVNGRIRTFNRLGATDGALEMTTNAFFESVRAGEPTADPRVRYDRLSGRWFITMRTVSIPPASNRMVLAVSNGGDIVNSSSFTFFQFPVTVDSTFPNGSFFDFPSLGVDKFALYIGGNTFEFNPSAPQDPFYTGTAGYVVRKADLLVGSLSVTPLGLMGDLNSPQGVDNDDPNATEGYFVGVDIEVFGQLDVMRISNPGGTPMAFQHNLTVPRTNYPKGGVLARGSTIPLDDVDDSLLIAKLHKGSLWTSHNISVLSSGLVPNDSSDGDRDASRWYEITNLTGTPVLNKWGTLFDPAVTRPREYWMPSCAMSGQGHMAIITSAARDGTNATVPVGEYAGIAASGRFANDPVGGPGNLNTPSAMQPPVIAQAGGQAYNLNDGSDPRHWGDYSSVTVDPMDDMTFWSVHEYCNGIDSWGVRVIQFRAPPPATPSAATQSSVAQGQTNANIVIAGTSSGGSGFFDPGVAFTKHVSASVNGGGVTVNSTVFTDPTHITLNVSVAANATLGSRTVTVTNPDSQSATSAAGIFTVTSPLDTDGDGIPDWWMQEHFGHATGQAGDRSLAGDDADGDTLTNLDEYRAGTDPRDPTSTLRVTAISVDGAGAHITFTSVAGRTYRLDYKGAITDPAWLPAVNNIAGQGGTTTVLEPGAIGQSFKFYRVLAVFP